MWNMYDVMDVILYSDLYIICGVDIALFQINDILVVFSAACFYIKFEYLSQWKNGLFNVAPSPVVLLKWRRLPGKQLPLLEGCFIRDFKIEAI